MIARVEAVCESGLMSRVAHILVKVYTSVKQRRSAQPLIKLIPDAIPLSVISAPPLNGQERAAPHLQPEIPCVTNIYVRHTTNQIGDCGHITPRAERVGLDTNWVDDVIDAMLNDNGRRASHIHLNGEARSPFKSIGLICDAIVLPEDSRAAHRSAND